MGRPKTPPSKAKSVFLGAFVDPKEAARIQRAISESEQCQSEWIRSAWTMAARPIWVVCKKWQASELHQKTVQFDIAFPQFSISGFGRFIVRPHRDRIRIAVEIESPLPEGAATRLHTLFLPQILVDAIERHADSTIAEFCCFGNATRVIGSKKS